MNQAHRVRILYYSKLRFTSRSVFFLKLKLARERA